MGSRGEDRSRQQNQIAAWWSASRTSDRNCRSWADRGLGRRWCGGRSQQDASRIRSKQFRSESTYLLLVGETGFEPATPWTRTRCLGSEVDRTPMAGAVWRVGDRAAPSAGLEAACADRDSNGLAPAHRPRQESYRSIASSRRRSSRARTTFRFAGTARPALEAPAETLPS